MFSVMFHRYRLYTHTFCVVFRSSFTTPICNVLYMLWSCFCVCTSVVVFTLGCLYIEPVNALLSVFLALHHTWGCTWRKARYHRSPLVTSDMQLQTLKGDQRRFPPLCYYCTGWLSELFGERLHEQYIPQEVWKVN